MIVIERTWREPDSRGGGRIRKAEIKAFDDNDIEGVSKFINEQSVVEGYEWTEVEYKYVKL